MLRGIIDNAGTVLVSLGLAILVGGIILYLFRERKKGHCSCGNSCCSCPMSGECHKTE